MSVNGAHVVQGTRGRYRACLEFQTSARLMSPGGLGGLAGSGSTGLTLSWQEAQSLPLLAVLGQQKGGCFERLRPEWTFFVFSSVNEFY